MHIAAIIVVHGLCTYGDQVVRAVLDGYLQYYISYRTSHGHLLCVWNEFRNSVEESIHLGRFSLVKQAKYLQYRCCDLEVGGLKCRIMITNCSFGHYNNQKL